MHASSPCEICLTVHTVLYNLIVLPLSKQLQFYQIRILIFSHPPSLADYRTCQDSDHRCGNGLCVDKAKRCDGYYDCRDKSDESDGCAGIACELGQFRCKDGNKCIAKYQKCNHRNECDDASDEENCSEYTCPFCVGQIA